MTIPGTKQHQYTSEHTADARRTPQEKKVKSAQIVYIIIVHRVYTSYMIIATEGTGDRIRRGETVYVWPSIGSKPGKNG